MKYLFPAIADCKTRRDLDSYGECKLETARAIVDGGRQEALRYARAFYDRFGPQLDFFREATRAEQGRLIRNLAADAQAGAKAALEFGPTRVVTNAYGHEIVCVPDLHPERGRFHGYMPWCEEDRLPLR